MSARAAPSADRAPGTGGSTGGLASVNGSVQVIGSSGGPGATLPTMPLGELANITFGNGPSEITRQDKQREIDINAGLNVPLGQAVGQATTVMNSVALPAGRPATTAPAANTSG